MGLNIELGQYCPTNSYLHRMHTPSKLCCIIALACALIFIQTPGQLLLGITTVVIVIAASNISIRYIVRSIRPLVVLIATIALVNMFVTQTGTSIFHVGIIHLTTGGLLAASLYSLRFVLALMMSSLILLTTTQAELTDAFDRLLAPCARLGLPAHEIAMVFSLMLRFIPVIAEETTSLIEAQSLRGASLGSGSLRNRLRALIPLHVSLFASCVRHANELAQALDARCYVGGSKRTHLHVQRFNKKDAVLVSATSFLLLGFIVLACIGI